MNFCWKTEACNQENLWIDVLFAAGLKKKKKTNINIK